MIIACEPKVYECSDAVSVVLRRGSVIFHILHFFSETDERILKLVHTLLNYRLLGTRTAAIFFQMIILSMHLCTSDGRHAWFHLYLARRPAIYQMKNSCPQWDPNQQPWDVKSDALPTELAGLVESCLLRWPYTFCNIHVLPIPM